MSSCRKCFCVYRMQCCWYVDLKYIDKMYHNFWIWIFDRDFISLLILNEMRILIYLSIYVQLLDTESYHGDLSCLKRKQRLNPDNSRYAAISLSSHILAFVSFFLSRQFYISLECTSEYIYNAQRKHILLCKLCQALPISVHCGYLSFSSAWICDIQKHRTIAHLPFIVKSSRVPEKTTTFDSTHYFQTKQHIGCI